MAAAGVGELKTVLTTGGAGFIGSNAVRLFIQTTDARIVNVDKLTYAGNLDSLADIPASPRYAFEQVDICDGPALGELFRRYDPDAVMHLAAESHKAIPTEDYPTPAPRPRYSVLEPSAALHDRLGARFDWQAGLASMLATLHTQLKARSS